MLKPRRIMSYIINQVAIKRLPHLGYPSTGFSCRIRTWSEMSGTATIQRRAYP